MHGYLSHPLSKIQVSLILGFASIGQEHVSSITCANSLSEMMSLNQSTSPLRSVTRHSHLWRNGPESRCWCTALSTARGTIHTQGTDLHSKRSKYSWVMLNAKVTTGFLHNPKSSPLVQDAWKRVVMVLNVTPGTIGENSTLDC